MSSAQPTPSDHFDGERFFNPGNPPHKTFWQLLKWQLSGTRVKWPRERANTFEPAVAQSVAAGEVVTTFINHATLLIQLGELNILTDPVFSKRVSPVSWAGPRRVRPPGLAFERLPRIDVVVISHNHYDHMDSESIRRLAEVHNPLFMVPLANGPLIEKMGGKRVRELDWWQSSEAGSISFTLVPAQHWSARGFSDRNKALWGGFVIRGQGLKIYFAGDTGYGPFFKDIRARLGAMDLSLLPIGAYEPRWFMKDHHMNPDEAVKAHKDLESRRSLGMHFGTFQLTDEGIDDPVTALSAALKVQAVNPEEFTAPDNGQTLSFRAAKSEKTQFSRVNR